MADQQQQQQQQQQVEFALSPGLVKGRDIIDYSTTNGVKLYKTATSPLKELHDLSAENLRDFLNLLEQRALTHSWLKILEIPSDISKPDEDKINLIHEYGSIDLDQVMAHADTYANAESREAQDSQQLAQCILNSLTVDARNTVTLCKDEYTVHDNISGSCLLKVVIRESHIDTNATTRIIREELGKLDTYMVKVDSDISKFNQHVKGLIHMLSARGKSTEDLLANLFKGYEAASDKDFVKYIQGKKDDYDEGEDVEPERLMLLALNKFKTKNQDGSWNAPTEEDEKIIALEARLNKLSQTKANKTSRTKTTPKPSDAMTRKRTRKPAWKLKPPKEGEPKKKVVNGKEYHWCETHEAWGRHLPHKCEGKGYIPDKRKANDIVTEESQEPDSNEVPNKKVRISKALMSILDEIDSDEE